MIKQREAVILVQGLGNQIPLSSISEFVENINFGVLNYIVVLIKLVMILRPEEFLFASHTYTWNKKKKSVLVSWIE